MTGPSRRFDPSELRTPGAAEPSAAELAEALGAARDLEALAASEGIRPTEGFDRPGDGGDRPRAHPASRGDGRQRGPRHGRRCVPVRGAQRMARRQHGRPAVRGPCPGLSRSSSSCSLQRALLAGAGVIAVAKAIRRSLARVAAASTTETTKNSTIVPSARTPTSIRSCPDAFSRAWSGTSTCLAVMR